MILRCFFRINIFELTTDIDSRTLTGPPSPPLSKVTLESKKNLGPFEGKIGNFFEENCTSSHRFLQIFCVQHARCECAAHAGVVFDVLQMICGISAAAE